MRQEHLKYLVCPESREPLEIVDETSGPDGRIMTGFLAAKSGKRYPIVKGIPRFVPADNYTASFGFQWNLYKDTQIDAHSGFDQSRRRFFEETRWPEDMRGKLILEAGSGAGRFTAHAVGTGAMVVSFDYSNAVEANFQTNSANDNLLLVQGDIFNPPFPQGIFDAVMCLGVLQHTPDPKRAFQSLTRFPKAGGRIATDIYFKSWALLFHIKTYMRPLLRGKTPEKVHAFTERYVAAIWPLVRLMRKTPPTRRVISRFVAEMSLQLPGATDPVLKEWAVLDTFDWFSPAYDNPQTRREFRAWHEEAKLAEVDVKRGWNGLEGRGRKSEA
ncbi:MAG: methyltransferase domain-containing protein [Fibrobacteria bacterium]